MPPSRTPLLWSLRSALAFGSRARALPTATVWSPCCARASCAGAIVPANASMRSSVACEIGVSRMTVREAVRQLDPRGGAEALRAIEDGAADDQIERLAREHRLATASVLLQRTRPANVATRRRRARSTIAAGMRDRI